ncbi:MAG: 50S ribosomal protein L23 [Spiroplasma sp.]|nr:50S ribosomal protein L23 [Mycoplasmatales bacterium]
MKTNAYEILKRPIITEKSMASLDNKVYTFEVEKSANKTHIKLAIEELFDVTVQKVNVINAKPRPRRVGKYAGYKSAYKKAIVTLTPESKEITTFEM